MENKTRTAIFVAVITVLGTVAGAVISNWDKLYPPPPEPGPWIVEDPDPKPVPVSTIPAIRRTVTCTENEGPMDDLATNQNCEMEEGEVEECQIRDNDSDGLYGQWLKPSGSNKIIFGYWENPNCVHIQGTGWHLSGLGSCGKGGISIKGCRRVRGHHTIRVPVTNKTREQSAPAEERAGIHIEQRSEGPNSPNVATLGDNSPVTINPDPKAPVITYMYNGNQRISTPGLIRDNPDNPARRAFPQIQAAHESQNWGELDLICDKAIKETPEWLTSYHYKAVAQANLGHLPESIELLGFVIKEASGNHDYEFLIEQATKLHEQIRGTAGR